MVCETHGVNAMNVDSLGGECPWCLLELQAEAAAADKIAMDLIRSGMFQWEPGTLEPETLKRLLIDAMADIFNNSGGSHHNPEQFCKTVAEAMFHATGFNGNAYLYVPA